jgi:hypothetical protein
MEKQRMNGTIERTDKEKSKCRKTLTHTAEINPFFTGVLRRYHFDGVGKGQANSMNFGNFEKNKNNGVFDPRNLELYSYSFNNPVVFIDPNGLDSNKVAANLGSTGFSIGYVAGDKGTSYFVSYGVSVTNLLPGSYSYSSLPQENPQLFSVDKDCPSFDETGNFNLTDPSISMTLSTAITPWVSQGAIQPWNAMAPVSEPTTDVDNNTCISIEYTQDSIIISADQ